MKKNSVILLSLTVLCCFMFSGCIYDEPPSESRPDAEISQILPDPEIRPKTGFIIATSAGSVEGTVSDDGSQVNAVLTQGSDAGLVLYLYEDKSFAPENSIVYYEYSWEVKKWADNSPNPKLMVRYGDASSSWKNYDPSYSEKTNYEDCSSKSGKKTASITLKSQANAIVFATNGYQWAGDSSDTVEITVTKISVKE